MSKTNAGHRENIIVIHPSSTKLRFGRSNDAEPITIPHCIGRKAKDSKNVIKQSMISDNRLSTFVNPKFNNAIKLASIAMKSSSIECLQPFKEQPTIYELIQMNKQYLKIETVNNVSNDNSTTYSEEFYIGKEALDLSSNANYNVSWPFWDDKISDKYSKTGAIKDLEDIWRLALEKWLKISPKDLPNYRVILVIPDLIIRCEIRWMVEMLINELKFSHIVVQQENVCVTYSTGLPTACVVNMHENSISISCIEEGISIPEGRIKLLYGTGDVFSLFHCLLVRIGFPKTLIESYSDYWGVTFLRELFETALTLTPSGELKVSKLSGSRKSIDPSTNNYYCQSINMYIATEAIIAGLALFHPSLICKESPKFQLQHNLSDESEPDDPFDDLYLTLTSRDRKKQRLDDGTANGTSFTNAPDDIDDDDNNGHSKINRVSNWIPESPGSYSQNDTNKALPLNDAIVKSINKSLNSVAVVIDNITETSQQLCSVILAGELLEFPGCVQWLQNSLKSSLSQCGDVEVIHNDFTDGIPAHSAAWKGATMITLVAFCDDLWISANDWNKYGSRAIREKAPFLWDKCRPRVVGWTPVVYEEDGVSTLLAQVDRLKKPNNFLKWKTTSIKTHGSFWLNLLTANSKCAPIGSHDSHHTKPHFVYYDDMESPYGSYSEHYKRKNQKYNSYLAGSTLLFIGTTITLYYVGVLDFEAAFYPPFSNDCGGLDFYEYAHKIYTEKSDGYVSEKMSLDFEEEIENKCSPI